MPIKAEGSKVPGLKRKSVRTVSSVRVKKWHSSCKKPDEVTLSGTPNTLISSGVGEEFVAAVNMIAYSNSNYTRFNPCTHIRLLRHPGPPTITLRYFNETLEEQSFDGCGKYDWISDKSSTTGKLELNLSPGELADGGFGTGWTSDDFITDSPTIEQVLQDCFSEAKAEMVPKLDDGFSLPQFLAELFEMKQLLRSIAQIVRGIAEYFMYSLRNMSLRSISGSYLAHQFGVLPLIADIKTIIQKFRSAGYTIRKYLDNQDKRMTYHFEKKLASSQFHPPSYFSQPCSATLNTTSPYDPWYFARSHFSNLALDGTRKYTVTDVEYHATMDFSYHLPNYGAGIQMFLAELDHYGINLSISDIWEIVPFSFLVDWVLKIGDSLEQLDLENLPVTVVINDFCQSLKFIKKAEFNIDTVSPLPWQPLSTTLDYTKECYYRWSGIPQANDGLKWPELNTNFGLWKVSILAALAGGRINRDAITLPLDFQMVWKHLN